MQESCNEVECSGASPTLDIVKTEPPSWTPEDFLQSTLHEGKGIICPAGGSDVAPTSTTKAPRGRRKHQWKLKFHHQALPPEYLDHYEASLNKSRPQMASQNPPKQQQQQQQQPSRTNAAQVTMPLYDLNGLPNEPVQAWLQRIASIQNEMKVKAPNGVVTGVPGTSSTPSRRRRTPPTSASAITGHSKVLNYRDLPYMGEMTLNNSKPRRGRKPKKADICHLIYKNYGTIFPGTPSHLVDERLHPAAPPPLPTAAFPVKQEGFDRIEALAVPNKQRTDLQNKIISSLLEKRLSQESKKSRDGRTTKKARSPVEEPQFPVEALIDAIPSLPSDELEPLNLCVRDLNNLKIRLLRKHGNVYAKAGVTTKTEPLDRSDNEDDYESPIAVDPVNEVPECSSPGLKLNEPDFKRVLRESASSSETTSPLEKQPEIDGEPSLPGGYVYWPNAGVFVHPLALQSQLLYYQGLAAGNSYTLPPDRSPALSAASGTATPAPEQQQHEPEPRRSPAASSEGSVASARSSKRPPSSSGSGQAPAAKRKRSAIFIPPVAADASTSPATEVSICKFKFTGGARPSLQEKKMLSVDAGGNFRYYSGTGDKASRGYEFFPRESLRQAGGGGPLTATPAPAPPTAVSRPSAVAVAAAVSGADPARRKRKSRKSLQREKLEQTFKEKGFLIQTQQLESAEGATYCKFRQLRKFTRYLFRSWKDYLPGALNNNEGEAPPAAAAAATHALPPA